MPRLSKASIPKQDLEQGQQQAAYMAELQSLHDRLTDMMPDMDPHVLLQILDAMLRPIGRNSGRRFLLRRGPDGSYAP